MGFDLQNFFDELNELLNSKNIEEWSKYDLKRVLKEYVASQEDYARRCGQL